MQGILLKTGAAAQGLYKAAQYSKTDVDVCGHACVVAGCWAQATLYTEQDTRAVLQRYRTKTHRPAAGLVLCRYYVYEGVY
jgi:hypothetical protein